MITKMTFLHTFRLVHKNTIYMHYDHQMTFLHSFRLVHENTIYMHYDHQNDIFTLF